MTDGSDRREVHMLRVDTALVSAGRVNQEIRFHHGEHLRLHRDRSERLPVTIGDGEIRKTSVRVDEVLAVGQQQSAQDTAAVVRNDHAT